VLVGAEGITHFFLKHLPVCTYGYLEKQAMRRVRKTQNPSAAFLNNVIGRKNRLARRVYKSTVISNQSRNDGSSDDIYC
jgi:hypothetical protein